MPWLLTTQVGEGRERWQTRLDRLKKECSAERALARDEVAQLSAKSEAAERGAKHAGAVAEEVSAKVKASLEDEFTQVCLKHHLQVVLSGVGDKQGLFRVWARSA